IPTAKNDRAAWLPPALKQLSEGATNFQHRRGAAVGIDGAEHPCITMISHDDPAISFGSAINPRDHVPKRARLIIHVRFQMHAHIIRAANVIRKRETTLEITRAQGTF